MSLSASSSVATAPNETFHLRGVSKTYGAVAALTDVDLQVRPGEVVALVGENGAGKSTLLGILGGRLSPDKGTITVGEQVLRLGSPREAIAAGIQIVQQEPTLLPDLTVAENILLGALPTRSARLVRSARTSEVAAKRLAQVGLSSIASMSTYVRDLGPAERQLVEIGKAVTHPTGLRLVAFDEPTSSLTEEATAHLFSVIAGLRASGVGIIYVTHRMREVFELADTIVVLRDGHSVATLAADQTTEDEVVRLMVGRDLTAMTRTEPRARNGDADRPPTLAIDSLSAVGLHDVSLTIHAGEVLGIAGLAKSGRSRLARCVFGDIPQKSGTVALFGKPLNRRTPHSSLKAGIALVPEDRHAQGLVLALSVTKNLTLGAVDRTLRTGRVVRTGRELMSASSTAQRLQIKAAGMSVTVDTLSGGNQQKVVLGRALSHQPALLILDEPTRGIDVGAKAEIYRLIRELASAGTAIMLISSELPELLALSDRIAVMQAGRIVGEVSGSEATEESVLSLAMPKSN